MIPSRTHSLIRSYLDLSAHEKRGWHSYISGPELQRLLDLLVAVEIRAALVCQNFICMGSTAAEPPLFFLRSRRCGILRITVKCPFLLDIATLVSGIQHHVMKASFRSGPMLSYISEAAFSGFYSLDGELFHCSFIYTGSISTVRGFSTVQGQRLHL